MKNLAKILIIMMFFSIYIQSQSNIYWLPVTAFPDNHFFPSYAWATSDWTDLPPEGVIGTFGGSIGITIKNYRDNATYKLKISAPEIAEETNYTFKIPTNSSMNLFNVYPNINYKWEKLKNTTQPTPANVTFTLYKNGINYGQKNVTIIVHSIYDCPYWLKRTDGSFTNLDWMFTAYVNENDPIIDKLLREALNTKIVKNFTGYMGNNSNEIVNNVWMQVTALWAVLYNRGITYSNVTTPSVGINEQKLAAQKVRFPSDALLTSQANCIDGTVLFASLLRRIGIKSRIVMIPGHAFVGFNYNGLEDSPNYKYLETTGLGEKVYESQVDTADINWYRYYLPADVYSANTESINNFLYFCYFAQKEFEDAKPNIAAGNAGYFILDVNKARDNWNILPISR